MIQAKYTRLGLEIVRVLPEIEIKEDTLETERRELN